MCPQFPAFKPVALDERFVLEEFLWKAKPEASEYTFINLFIWRWPYRMSWSPLGRWVLFCFRDGVGTPHGLQPVGAEVEPEVIGEFLNWLRAQDGPAQTGIERVEERWALAVQQTTDLVVEPDPDQFDYVYRTQDLIELAGRK